MILQFVFWLYRKLHRCEWCGAKATTYNYDGKRERRFCDVHGQCKTYESAAWNIANCKRCEKQTKVYIWSGICPECSMDKAAHTCLFCQGEFKDDQLITFTSGRICIGCHNERERRRMEELCHARH